MAMTAQAAGAHRISVLNGADRLVIIINNHKRRQPLVGDRLILASLNPDVRGTEKVLYTLKAICICHS